MFALMKALSTLVMPLGMIVMALVIGLLLQKRFPRRAFQLMVAAVVALYISSLTPTAWLVEASLSQNGSPEIREPVDAIVVLAGGASTSSRDGLTELSGASWRRWWRAIEMYETLNGTVPILYSGGSGDAYLPVSYEAVTARSLAEKFGIARSEFWIEEQSRTTHENALAIRTQLDERWHRDAYRVVLVTSEIHMKRSLGALNAVGIDVVPVVADTFDAPRPLHIVDLLPSVGALERVTRGLHEWYGIVWYRILYDIRFVGLPVDNSTLPI